MQLPPREPDANQSNQQTDPEPRSVHGQKEQHSKSKMRPFRKSDEAAKDLPPTRDHLHCHAQIVCFLDDRPHPRSTLIAQGKEPHKLPIRLLLGSTLGDRDSDRSKPPAGVAVYLEDKSGRSCLPGRQVGAMTNDPTLSDRQTDSCKHELLMSNDANAPRDAFVRLHRRTTCSRYHEHSHPSTDTTPVTDLFELSAIHHVASK